MPDSPDLAEPEASFVWPGEAGFKNFPKQIPDDCIEYSVHVIPSASSDGTISSQLQLQTKIRARLQEIRRGANELIQQYVTGYVWQREAFALEIVQENRLIPSENPEKTLGEAKTPEKAVEKVVGPHLAGSTSFGDSIADEWLVVFLLRELSRRFKDAWIHVCDGDGEFLLVEAANVLPRWLNPEVAPNRVWVHDGQLRIIPLDGASDQTKSTKPNSGKDKKSSRTSSRPGTAARELNLAEALSFIQTSPDALIHFPQIEEEAFYRLRNHPAQISSALHNARIRIPRLLAYVLHTAPSHISPAIDAFYLRDPISVRPLRGEAQSLKFPPEDFVTVSVCFTRVSYAQLKSQEFPVPRAWAKAMVPAATIAANENNSDTTQQEQPFENAAAVTGMKVTCGFEMLLADPQARDRRCVREIELLLDDVEEDATLLPSDKDIASWCATEDDEKWLDVNFEDFEAELAGSSKKGAADGSSKDRQFGDQAAQENLQKIVEKFELFLNDEDAGPDGAELGDEMDDDDSDEDDSGSATSGEDQDASFDEGDFWIAMRDMMGIPPSEGLPATGTGKTAQRAARDKPTSSRIQELGNDEEVVDDEEDDDDDDDDDEGDILELTRRMEAELKAAGAFHVDDDDISAGKRSLRAGASSSQDEVDIDNMSDYVLAKNLLESFKSQGGAAGPVGNMMRLMGLDLPRDEDDSQNGKAKASQS